MGPTRRSEIVGTTMAAVAFALSVLTGVVTAFLAPRSPRAGVAWVVAPTSRGSWACGGCAAIATARARAGRATCFAGRARSWASWSSR
ncbi:MAG: hypothetical protein U0325_25695 [Polyangiales bacterium]